MNKVLLNNDVVHKNYCYKKDHCKQFVLKNLLDLSSHLNIFLSYFASNKSFDYSRKISLSAPKESYMTVPRNSCLAFPTNYQDLLFLSSIALN